MKPIYLILLLILVGCEPNIKNDQATLNTIFEMERFEIEIGVFGCFGGEMDIYELEKVDTRYKLTYIKSKKSIFITSEKVDSLKSFLKTRITAPEKLSLCTGSMYFRAGTRRNSIDFTDRSCGDWDIINGIMHFSDVLDNE